MGHIVLLMSVGPSVRRFLPTIILKTFFYHRAFIFHMLIGLGEDENPSYFGFTRSKVKVTSVT